MSAPGSEDGDSDERTFNRRQVVSGIGTAAAAGLGGVVATNPATATGSIEIVDFDETRSGEFEAGDDLPVVDELFVFVHGWLGDTSVHYQAQEVLSSVEQGGYTPDAAVAIRWPATNLWYPEPEQDTEGVGAELATLVEAFTDDGGGAVRLTGHSLGGRVAYWTPNALGSGYEVDTVGAMGTAAYGSRVCVDGGWYDGVANNAGPVRNYHSENDRVVGTAYGGGDTVPLGTDGAPCSGASNYTDVDVSSTVRDHLDYLGDQQVGDDFAAVVLND